MPLWVRRPTAKAVRIRLHKILNEGRTVRFEKPEEDTIDVNVIVFQNGKPVRPKQG